MGIFANDDIPVCILTWNFNIYWDSDCYSSEAEEGWGRELPVIADTFALSIADIQ